MKELTNDIIESLKKKQDILYSKIDKISEQIKEEKRKLINLDKFEGKYIKYHDTIFGGTVYMLVDCIMRDKTRYTNYDYCYMFRGLGFSSEFTGYGDATSFSWDYWYEFYFHGNESDFFEKIEKEITIITKEEFNKEFENVIKQLKEFHYTNKYNK